MKRLSSSFSSLLNLRLIVQMFPFHSPNSSSLLCLSSWTTTWEALSTSSRSRPLRFSRKGSSRPCAWNWLMLHQLKCKFNSLFSLATSNFWNFKSTSVASSSRLELNYVCLEIFFSAQLDLVTQFEAKKNMSKNEFWSWGTFVDSKRGFDIRSS